MKPVVFWIAAAGASVSGAASAHVVLQEMEGRAAYQEYVTLVVPHGCGNSPTTEIRVKVPDGIPIVSPEQKPGWTLRITRRKLDTPQVGEGGTRVTDVVDQVSWSGGNVPSDQMVRFTMLVRTPDTPDKILYFKTIQKCANEEVRWVDTVPDGEPAWKVWARPAPSPFMVLKKADKPQLGATMQQIAAERKKLGPATKPQP